MSFLTEHTSNESPTVVKPRVMGMILTVAACLIISTNILVAVALLKLLLRKSSQSWCFVLNLAVADTLVGVAITGLATEDFNSGGNNVTQSRQGNIPAEQLMSSSSSIQGRTRCLIRMAFVTSPCTASILSMFLISLDRYAAIKMPLRYSQRCGKGTAVGCLVTLWICAVTLGFLPVVVRSLQSERYNGVCAFFSVIYDMGIIILYSVCFFPVFSVFVYIYLDILKIACSHQKQICQVRQAGSRTAEHQSHPHHHHHHQQQQLRSRYWSHVKALRTVAVLVGCFLLLWCPFFVVCIVALVCKTCELTELLENHLWLLGLSNSLINPLVYAFWQKEVRMQIAAMFACFTGRPSAAAASGVTGRCEPPRPADDHTAAAGGDYLRPSMVQSNACRDEAFIVPLSASTGL